MIDLSTFFTVLPWVLPPLLGAGIGYLTNSLAIRMLFRPLRRIRLFGVPIPFTPGVIPRQRDELAESIGAMVARDLLTPDVFAQRFQTPEFRRGIRQGVYHAIDGAMHSSVSRVRGIIAPELVVTAVGEYLLEHVCRSRETVDWIARVLSEGLVAHSEEVTSAVDRAIGEMTPFAAVDRDTTEGVVMTLWPSVRLSAEHLLQKDSTRRKMEEIVRRILSYTLDQLTGLQRLMVSAGQYDRQILARVPSIVSRATAEFNAVLANPETRTEVVDRIDDWVREHRDVSVSAVLSDDARSTIHDLVQRGLSDPTVVATRLQPVVAPLFGEQSCRALVAHLETWVGRWIESHEEVPIGILFPALSRSKALIAYRTAGPIASALSELTPNLFAHLDIRRVVVERINRLEIDRVEELLLGIIRRHLRWINMFGAILGALIGASQLVLRVLGV